MWWRNDDGERWHGFVIGSRFSFGRERVVMYWRIVLLWWSLLFERRRKLGLEWWSKEFVCLDRCDGDWYGRKGETNGVTGCVRWW